MVKRPKKFVIVDDSSPAVAQAKSREQRVPSFFRVKNGNTKWCPVRQTCKSMNFSRRKRAAACFLTAVGPVITKTADRKTIMNCHTRGQTRKLSSTIMKNFESAQTEWWLMTVNDSELMRIHSLSYLSQNTLSYLHSFLAIKPSATQNPSTIIFPWAISVKKTTSQ